MSASNGPSGAASLDAELDMSLPEIEGISQDTIKPKDSNQRENRQLLTATVATLLVTAIFFAMAAWWMSDEDDALIAYPAWASETGEGLTPPHHLVYEIPIHFVLAGVDESKVNAQAILDRMVANYTPWDTGRSMFVDGFPVQHEEITYEYTYILHTAPEEFRQDLFAYAQSGATQDNHIVAGPASGPTDPNWDYLVEYDQAGIEGHNRFFGGIMAVDEFDAEACELWIEENKGEYDLDFSNQTDDDGNPIPTGYTFFLLDGWSDSGPRQGERYHYWDYKATDWDRRGTDTMRAWGGEFDFLWLDLSAAPNIFEAANDANPTGSAGKDPPIWDVGQPGYLTVAQYEDRLFYDLETALMFRFTPSFIYHPTWAPAFHINVLVYWEDGSTMPCDGAPECQLDFDEMLTRIRQGFPWATITGEIREHHEGQADDDDGFNGALAEAKQSTGNTYVAAEPIIKYLEHNREEYFTGPEGSFNFFMGFVMFEGHYTFAAPVAPQGVANPGPDGKPWGVFSSNNDIHRMFGTAGTDVAGDFPWTSVAAHEAGHFFGLHHPHDGVIKNEQGEYGDRLEWLWDQSMTIMSYRSHSWTMDGLDKDVLARGNTMEIIHSVDRDLEGVIEVFRAEGLKGMPEEYGKEVLRLKEVRDTLLERSYSGEVTEVMFSFIQLLNDSTTLREEVFGEYGASWEELEEVLSMTVQMPGEGEHEYQQVTLNESWMKLVVELDWENSGAGCDAGIGWSYDGTRGAVFDYRYNEQSGTQNETLVIDLFDDGIREHGTLYIGPTCEVGDGSGIDAHFTITALTRSAAL